MSAHLETTFPTLERSPRRDSLRNLADTALKASARFWFLVTVIGQLLFAFAIASFYGTTAARGDLEAWNRLMLRGHVDGRAAGNLAVYLHLAAGVIVIVAGALQFVPQVRARFPAFHRWSGRLYMLSALILSVAGLYMQWANGSFGDETLRWGCALNAGLIWICAAMALRSAIGGDFTAHRRWALRLFLVVGGAWFFRVALFLSVLIFKGPAGFDPSTFSGPLLTSMAFAQFLIPLAPLELYFFVQSRPGAGRRIAMAGLLFFLTVATGAGVFAISAAIWMPNIQAAFDSRKSIARTLSPILASSGEERPVNPLHRRTEDSHNERTARRLQNSRRAAASPAASPAQ